jgi:hypothetical protein
MTTIRTWRRAARAAVGTAVGAAVGAAVGTAVLTAAGTARAEGKDGKPEELVLPPVAVQVQDDEFNHALTLYLIVPDQKKLYLVCRRAPHIFEAVTLYVNRHPLRNLPKKEGSYLPELSKKLEPRVIRAASNGWVVKVHAFLGQLTADDGPRYKPRITNPVGCERVFFRRKSIDATD